MLGEDETYVSLHVYQTQPLADVVTDDNDVGVEQAPVFWT